MCASSEKAKLLASLFDAGECELEDVKFFRGDNPNVTEEDLCREANRALRQLDEGATDDMPVSVAPQREAAELVAR